MEDMNNPSSSSSTATKKMLPPVREGDEITPAPDPGAPWDNARLLSSTTQQLTVDRKWKVDEELAYRMSEFDEPSRIVPVAKWIVTILLATAITFLFVATKLSFIYLSLALNKTTPTTGPSEDGKNLDQWAAYTGQFLVIYLVISVPYFLLCLRAAWEGLFAKENPWPCKSAVLCCVVIGVLEPLGLIVLALKVLTKVSPHLGVLIMSTVIALPIFLETVKFWRSQARSAMKVVMTVSFVLVIAGSGMTAYMVYKEIRNSIDVTKDAVHIVVSVVCLSIAWLPSLMRLANQKPIDVEENDGGCLNLSVQDSFPTLETEETSTSSTSDSPETTFEIIDVTSARRFRKKFHQEATWKASFILYLIKTVATFGVSFIFFYIDSDFIRMNFSEAAHSAFITAWDFDSNNVVGNTWLAFGVNLVGALVCYVIAFIASHTNMQRGCLAIPFILSLPLAVFLTTVRGLCDAIIDDETMCQSDSTAWYYMFGATLTITIAQTLSFGRRVFREERIYLQQEDKLFWIPGYNGAILDAWLLLDRRHTSRHVTAGRNSKSGKMRVYICTTMYREDEREMQQLLESLAKINVAQAQGETFFESHIIFDGGVKQRNISEFSLILISLLEDTLGVLPTMCTKIITPYGMKLSWGLFSSSRDKPQMTFNIHLKDNTLVKNKKRWSQVMYMSYVLDFLSDTAISDEELYILTTDADVMFTPESVEALLDLMSRDPSIGAVCARTHPMGSGPLVWFQIFEYAVGHWFQKAAEHVLGSVLCAPGCFSVYRCRALRDILPKYCKKVESSFDFLTKDMGEDRWLCTLMVQSGWRIEYCAASENSTNCPSEFEEFYKQRRRWIASTLANLMLIIKEWKYIALFNHRVSVVFLLYQVLLLVSTLIAPSTVILVVAGGVVFAWHIDPVAAVLLQVIACVLFAMACILTAPKTHILLAKIYTFLYAVIMCAVAVGTAEQIVTDLSDDSDSVPSNNTHTSTHKPASQHISMDIPVSITTIYFAFLVLMFTLTGLLHPREITCLFHGICFLLCLPSAYLVLMIYSICNLTDSSWGTREGETVSSSVKKASWSEVYKKIFYTIFFCWTPKSKPGRGVDAETQTAGHPINRLNSSGSPIETPLSPYVGDGSAIFRQASGDYLSGDWQRLADVPQEQLQLETEDIPISVDEWLPPEFRSTYAEVFKKHGFDSTLFIKGLTETDLNRMGIKKRGHVQFLMTKISMLPAFEIEYKVPTNVSEWLQEIGLVQYSKNFQRNHIRTPKEMEILKRFDRHEIEKELGITKEGHVKRLMEAIKMLRDPSESQQKAIRMRQAIDETPVHYLKEFNVAEYEFWSRLREKCLEPDLKAFGIDAEVKVKLVELRNNWLLVMAVANTLWLILIITLATKGDLTFLGANPVGVVFLFIFGFIFLVQFLAMIVHRISTLSHYVARAPYTFGRPFQTSWSFKDKADRGFEDTADVNAIHQTKQAADRALKKAAMRARKPNVNSRHHVPPPTDESTPLLNNSESNPVY